MTSMKVLSRDDIHEGSAPLVPLKEWELVELPDPDLEYVGLVFRPGNCSPGVCISLKNP